jgi:UDP-N-acetylmuramoyl-tripeptide--D-alanyl-D-alanine ligase
MRSWDAERIALASGAELLRGGEPGGGGPERAVIDSRAAGAGDLFAGLPGATHDGGEFAAQALGAGAWGTLTTPGQAERAAAAQAGGVVLAHPEPLPALQALAGAWRAELQAHGARVVAITGSTGKTSTKDILTALLAPLLATVGSRENLNTEIGLPLSILEAPERTELLVLEMAMRGAGQIAELTAIADPDVGVIVNVGPAHLELMGSLENIAAAKAELLAGMRPGTSAIVPAGETLLAPHIRAEQRTITFGEGGDVTLRSQQPDGTVVVAHGELLLCLRPSFGSPHQLRNLLAAVAAARALELAPEGELHVSFSSMRGQRTALAGDVLLIEDCYNANPMSMRAAIDDLAETSPARRVAVLGDMLELGAQGPQMHREIGRHAHERGVEVLVAVGPLAAEMLASFGGEALALGDAAEAAQRLPSILQAGDTVLVKGSRGVGLERVAQALRDARAPLSAAGSGLR